MNNDGLFNLDPIYTKIKTRHKNINPVSKLCCIVFKVTRLLNILHHWYTSNYVCPIYFFDRYSNREISTGILRSLHGHKLYLVHYEHTLQYSIIFIHACTIITFYKIARTHLNCTQETTLTYYELNYLSLSLLLSQKEGTIIFFYM